MMACFRAPKVDKKQVRKRDEQKSQPGGLRAVSHATNDRKIFGSAEDGEVLFLASSLATILLFPLLD